MKLASLFGDFLIYFSGLEPNENQISLIHVWGNIMNDALFGTFLLIGGYISYTFYH